MNIVRLKFSHDFHEYHQFVIHNFRNTVAANPNDEPLAIALDTKDEKSVLV